MTPIDWRDLPGERMAALYRAEAARWATHLAWDISATWQEVDAARQRGTLSGVAVIDDAGRVVGWSYFLVYEGALQVGGFVADSGAAVQLMADAILSQEVLASVDAVTVFAYGGAPGLAAALHVRGLSVERYWYFGKDLPPSLVISTADVRRWRLSDLSATAELFARAYGAADEARPFAPRSTPADWLDYVAQLAGGTGCGVLEPDACFCVADGSQRLLAVALVTRVAERTAHLAQLAVDPDAQGRSHGARLLALGCAAAAEMGCDRITLLVGARNARARALYDRAGFAKMGTFVAAGTLQPRRSTSVAPGAVVITRR